MTTLVGKFIVIVGGTSGIGLAVAKASLLSFASSVLVASSTKAKVDSARAALQTLVAEKGLPGKGSGKVLDGEKMDEVKKFIEGVGEIDHLVWTGGNAPASLGSFTIEQMQEALTLRFYSPVAAAKAAKIRPGGSVTFTTGTVAFKPSQGWGIAAGLGGAIDAVTRGLAVDLAPVRVNIICPGYVDTDLYRNMPEERRAAVLKHALEKSLVKHVDSGDEVAEAYLFVMKCNYITGQTIHADGGILLG